jgi:hypothetical protein
VCAEANTVLRLQRRISSLTVGIWRSLRITVFGKYHGASTIIRNVFDWERSRTSVLEVTCIPQISLGIVIYMRSLLLVESFDLRPSNQYILVMVIRVVSVLRKCLCGRYDFCQGIARDTWHHLLGEVGRCLYGPGCGHVSLMVNVTWLDLDPLVFILRFLNQYLIASRLVCSFFEAIVWSLSVASTAVSSAKVAVVDSGEVGRSAEYSRYNNGPKTLPWGTTALTDESSVHSVLTLTRKCLLCK